jgi:hypothetical protein
MRPLLREAGVINDQHPVRPELPGDPGLQAVANRLSIPGTLVEELLQGWLVILGPLFNHSEPGRHRLDALAVTIQQQATHIRFAPPPPTRVAQRAHDVVQEQRPVLPQFGKRPGIHPRSLLNPQKSSKMKLTE